MTKLLAILRRADINRRWNNIRRRTEEQENVNAGDGKISLNSTRIRPGQRQQRSRAVLPSSVAKHAVINTFT